MKLALISLVLVVCANAGLLGGLGEKIKNILTNEKSIGEKMKKMFLNNTHILKIKEKMEKLARKIKKTLHLTPKGLASLKKRLSSMRPIKQKEIKKTGDSIDEINEKSEVGSFLFQGDIILTGKQAEEVEEDVEEEATEGNRTKRQAFKDRRYPKTIWSNGVNYYFDYSASPRVRSVFKKGARLWEKDTCINFREDPYAEDKIRVFAAGGCWSYVGKIGGRQNLSLGRGCETIGIAAHELGHALGLFHTMSRHDRDSFIIVNAYNIKPDWLSQFTRQTPLTNENYGVTYDYGSIMHYGATSASYNRQPTMVPFDIMYRETLGSPFVSFYDLLVLNTHYNCLNKCNGEPNAAKCDMGGVPHPRDCTRCLCPGGYSGTLCNERPPGCGEVLTATTRNNVLSKTIGNPYMNEGEDFEICHYWIESPPETRIVLIIEAINGYYAVDGCPYFGVEIKTQKDQKTTGYRFCAYEDVGVTLQSHSNRVPVIIYSREGQAEVKLQYRYVTDSRSGPKPTTDSTTLPPPPTTSTLPSVVKPKTNLRCVDMPACSMLKNIQFCTSPKFTTDIKVKMCPKMCGYC